MMLVPLSGTMSLLFSPFGERAWVGPFIWVSRNVEQIVCSLFAQERGKRKEKHPTGTIAKAESERKRERRERREREPRLRVSFLRSAYSSQISALMTSLRPVPRDRWGWLPGLRTVGYFSPPRLHWSPACFKTKATRHNHRFRLMRVVFETQIYFVTWSEVTRNQLGERERAWWSVIGKEDKYLFF